VQTPPGRIVRIYLADAHQLNPMISPLVSPRLVVSLHQRI
jgi:hypothetical protein